MNTTDENKKVKIVDKLLDIINCRRLSVKTKIMLLVIPVMIVGLSFTIYLGYTMTERIFMDEYERDQEQVKAQVVNTVHLIDSGFRMLERKMEQDMAKAIIEFREEFAKAGGNADAVDLVKIKEKLGAKYDLMVIDKSTTIIEATLKDGLNFNFMKFSSKVGADINQIRQGNEIRHERIRTNVGTGFLSKFSYVSSKDHKYVLELVYEQGEPDSLVQEMDPLKTTAKLVAANPIVSEIKIYDAFGFEFVNTGKNYQATKESKAIVDRAFKEKEYKIVVGNKEKIYKLIDLNHGKPAMTDNSKIIGITFDKSVIYTEMEKIIFATLMIGFVIIMIMVLMIIYLSRRITQPITMLVNAVQKVAKGDYSAMAEKTSNDEIGELSVVFNSMTERIKQNFEKIEIQKNELEDYSRNLERKVAERTAELKEERELMKATLLSIGDGVISTDRTGKIQIVNKVAEGLLGWSQEEAYEKPFDSIYIMYNEHENQKSENPIQHVLRSGEIVSMANPGVLVDRNGVGKPVESIAAPIRDEYGRTNGAVVVFRDFTEKKERIEKIEYLSLHDQLTGLYNRRFFQEELKRLDTARNLPLSFVMLDVNGLKLINDAFGHTMGDMVLQQAAEIMQAECRGDDIIARIGGDEFVILLPGTGMQEADTMLRRIHTIMEKHNIGSINMSISYGLATKRNMTENISEIFKLAEDHMYRRKLSESKSMHYRTIDIIMKTLHEKSEREKKHSERVSRLSEAIGRAMSLRSEDIKDLATTGLMHDIGKIAIDLSILDKPGQLSVEERTEIERHPEQGYQILRSINEFAKLAEFVLAHHERWDGSGYPSMLAGEEIPLAARIIAVADAYDAMTSDRAYRKALSREAALIELERHAGTQFDPEIVRLFVEQEISKE